MNRNSLSTLPGLVIAIPPAAFGMHSTAPVSSSSGHLGCGHVPHIRACCRVSLARCDGRMGHDIPL